MGPFGKADGRHARTSFWRVNACFHDASVSNVAAAVICLQIVHKVDPLFTDSFTI